MNFHRVTGFVILGTLDTFCHFVMTTTVRFGIILVSLLGLRKSNDMNKICHWSSAELA